jgi:hypothetical protein
VWNRWWVVFIGNRERVYSTLQVVNSTQEAINATHVDAPICTYIYPQFLLENFLAMLMKRGVTTPHHTNRDMFNSINK